MPKKTVMEKLKKFTLSPVPSSCSDEAKALVVRMVDNGLEAEQVELEQVVFYLVKTYAKQ